MKKITLLSLAAWASILLTFAHTDSESKISEINNVQYINETVIEINSDIESDEIYNSILNDFENYLINSTVAEEVSDSLETELYNHLLEYFNKQ
jgi:hypothetical protein